MTVRPRILLVEDDADTREILAELLSELYEVVCSGDGDEGLALARTADVQVVITDHSLPGLTGTQLARTLKAEGVPAPVILMSGFRSGLDTSACDVVLPKPIEVADLLRAIDRLLAERSAATHASS